MIRGGRGAPLLVLAPELAPGRWFPYHEQLSGRFQIFAPDHPGFGASERPEWLDGIDDLAIFYLDLLDQLGLERVAVLGTSLGGWIAAELAVLQPQRVDHLVLVGAAGLRVEGVERYDLFLNPIETTLAHLFHDPARIAQLLPDDVGPDTVVQAYRDATTLARVAWNPYLYDPKLERRLRRIHCPTLIVWGEHDRFLPLPHGELYAAAIPGATLRVIPGCGHLVPFEDPQEFARIALEFLG